MEDSKEPSLVRLHLGDDQHDLAASAPQFHASDDGQDSSEHSGLLHTPNRKPKPVHPPPDAQQLSAHKKAEEDIEKMPSKVKEFYKNQNNIILSFLEMEDMQKDAATHAKEQEAAAHALSKQARLAVNISFGMNIVLFIIKAYAAIVSHSLAVLASALDSSLDLLSGLLLFLIARKIRKRDPYKFPVSNTRMEPVGVIVFACIMGMLSLFVIEDSVTTLAGGSADLSVGWDTLGVLLFAIATKSTLFIYCKMYSDNSMAAALAQDHRNDLFTNTVGIVAAALAANYGFLWWTDGAGAIVLSMYIIISWIRTGTDQANMLIGISAPPQMLAQLTYLAAHHDSRILRVDKVLAYHIGHKFLCEVDIVLPEDMMLREAHDIGEGLEKKIEAMEEVERAFVHLDYEWTHKAEHKIITASD